jgi:hypothetical protein
VVVQWFRCLEFWSGRGSPAVKLGRLPSEKLPPIWTATSKRRVSSSKSLHSHCVKRIGHDASIPYFQSRRERLCRQVAARMALERHVRQLIASNCRSISKSLRRRCVLSRCIVVERKPFSTARSRLLSGETGDLQNNLISLERYKVTRTY